MVNSVGNEGGSSWHYLIAPSDVDVITEADTRTMAWSIASGNYSNRFASAVTSAVVQVAADATSLAAEVTAWAREEAARVTEATSPAGGETRPRCATRAGAT